MQFKQLALLAAAAVPLAVAVPVPAIGDNYYMGKDK